MHQEFAKRLRFKTIIALTLLCAGASGGDSIGVDTSVLARTTVKEEAGLTGETEFVTLEDTSATLVLAIDPASRVAKSVTRTDASGSTTHSRAADGSERIISEQVVDGKTLRSELKVGNDGSSATLLSLSSRPNSRELPKLPDLSSNTPVAKDCLDTPLTEAAYAIGEKAIAEQVLNRNAIENCGEQTADIAKYFSEISSQRSKDSKSLLTCAKAFERYRQVIEIGERSIDPSRIKFVCTNDATTSSSGTTINLGSAFRTESKKANQRAMIFGGAMLIAGIDENEIPNLTACCAGDANDNKSCAFQTWMGMKTVPITYGIRELLRESQVAGAKAEALDAFNDEA
ncbi:MAG: hypothetical protein EOP06_11580, partial [Proteobacteria bacterium]